MMYTSFVADTMETMLHAPKTLHIALGLEDPAGGTPAAPSQCREMGGVRWHWRAV